MEMLSKTFLLDYLLRVSPIKLTRYQPIMNQTFTINIAIAFATILNAFSTVPCNAEDHAVEPTKHRIDTHIHLYDTRRDIEITWPPESDKVLYQPHLPQEYSRIAKASGVTGVVIVEASLRYEDNQWALDLVADDPFYIGLVGNIDVTQDNFKEKLIERKSDSRFVGIRPRNRAPIDFTDPTVLSNLKTLADHDLAMDYLTNGGGIEGLRVIEAVASKIPNLRIVVNHCLGYNFDGKSPPSDWVETVKKLASHQNVYCKISGLYQRSTQQPAPQNISYFQDILEVLWNEFGQDRIIYGSNWPVTKHTGSYKSFVKLVDQFISSKGQAARESYYWENASRAYKLGLGKN
jgi:L-fuconolactonase